MNDSNEPLPDSFYIDKEERNKKMIRALTEKKGSERLPPNWQPSIDRPMIRSLKQDSKNTYFTKTRILRASIQILTVLVFYGSILLYLLFVF